jgi:bifunctional non-homologous end joining protein LigD
MYSKRGNRFSRFEELRQRICKELPRRELILDGEIVAINPDGFVDFYAMMRGDSHLTYVAFDVLWHNGRDLRGLPLGAWAGLSRCPLPRQAVYPGRGASQGPRSP